MQNDKVRTHLRPNSATSPQPLFTRYAPVRTSPFTSICSQVEDPSEIRTATGWPPGSSWMCVSGACEPARNRMGRLFHTSNIDLELANGGGDTELTTAMRGRTSLRHSQRVRE